MWILNAVLSIRESKGRVRLVPFRPDLTKEFNEYLPMRAAILSVPPEQFAIS